MRIYIVSDLEAEDMPALVAKLYGHDLDWQPFWNQYPSFSDYPI